MRVLLFLLIAGCSSPSSNSGGAQDYYEGTGATGSPPVDAKGNEHVEAALAKIAAIGEPCSFGNGLKILFSDYLSTTTVPKAACVLIRNEIVINKTWMMAHNPVERAEFCILHESAHAMYSHVGQSVENERIANEFAQECGSSHADEFLSL